MSEVKLSQFDCGSCPNITDGCFGQCQKAKPEVVRMFVNWNMQEYFQHKDGDIVWLSDFDAQRLRADTAETELKRLDNLDTMQLIAELTKRNAAAEQRIAEMWNLLREALEEPKDGDDWIDRVVAALNQKSEGESQ